MKPCFLSKNKGTGMHQAVTVNIFTFEKKPAIWYIFKLVLVKMIIKTMQKSLFRDKVLVFKLFIQVYLNTNLC